MGLSSREVASDHGINWSEILLQAQTLELPKPPQVNTRRQQSQNQQQSESLKCPRCDSTNTKFCYYNNYNKSQPRHLCKSCQRHWTKGGTLRNVPVGGGRKNKRPKTSTKASADPNTTTNTSGIHNINRASRPHMVIQAQPPKLTLPLAPVNQNSISAVMHQAPIRPPSSVLRQNSISRSNLNCKILDTNIDDVFFPGSALSANPNPVLHFPYPNSSAILDANPSSVSTSFQPSTDCNSNREAAMDDSIIATVAHNSSSTLNQPWEGLNTSRGLDMASGWNWDDMDNFASADLNIPWDDSQINP